eukprot:1158551-Pelagomonas_calceolata.AAC.3
MSARVASGHVDDKHKEQDSRSDAAVYHLGTISPQAQEHDSNFESEDDAGRAHKSTYKYRST